MLGRWLLRTPQELAALSFVLVIYISYDNLFDLLHPSSLWVPYAVVSVSWFHLHQTNDKPPILPLSPFPCSVVKPLLSVPEDLAFESLNNEPLCQIPSSRLL